MTGIPCERCGEVALVEDDRDPIEPAWCDRCLTHTDVPTLPVRVIEDDRAPTHPLPKVIKFVTLAEREERDAADYVESLRSAAHLEAVGQLQVAMDLTSQRRCRGLVVAAIFENPDGTTAMLTSVPQERDGIYSSALLGAVHHASFRLHHEVEQLEQLAIPNEDPPA